MNYWLRKIIAWGIVLGIVYFAFQEIRFANMTPCERLSEQLMKVATDQNNPFGHVIDFVDLHDKPNTSNEVQCTAVAMLSNGMKMNVLLRQYQEYGKTWVKSEPQGVAL